MAINNQMTQMQAAPQMQGQMGQRPFVRPDVPLEGVPVQPSPEMIKQQFNQLPPEQKQVIIGQLFGEFLNQLRNNLGDEAVQIFELALSKFIEGQSSVTPSSEIANGFAGPNVPVSTTGGPAAGPTTVPSTTGGVSVPGRTAPMQRPVLSRPQSSFGRQSLDRTIS
jgi:hypothetical protein